MSTSLRAFSIFLFLVIGFLSLDADACVLRGRIRDATTGTGIADLTVRLVPPKSTAKPHKITVTSELGDFVFDAVEKGRYLLEIYQGVSLIYREVIEFDTDREKQIDLQRSFH